MQALAALLAAVTLAPVCGEDGREALRREFVAEINRGREAAGREPLRAHPVLCEIAAWRAAGVEASGRSAPDIGLLQQATRRFYRGGYAPHAWIESTVISDPRFPRLPQWEDARPGWLGGVFAGEWEHVGVAIGSFGALEVATVVVARPKCSAEEERVAPLRDLEAVRRGALAAVDRERAERGLRPVKVDPGLDAAAQAYAERMQREGFYRHVAPDGSGPAGRAGAAGGVVGRGVSENIAKGLFTPAEVVARWMNSAGHRQNILDPEARVTGLGLTVGPPKAPGECFEIVWVQMFARGE